MNINIWLTGTELKELIHLSNLIKDYVIYSRSISVWIRSSWLCLIFFNWDDIAQVIKSNGLTHFYLIHIYNFDEQTCKVLQGRVKGTTLWSYPTACNQEKEIKSEIGVALTRELLCRSWPVLEHHGFSAYSLYKRASDLFRNTVNHPS